MAATAGDSFAVVRRQLFVLSLFPFSEAIAWTSIFPYIYSMVRWLNAVRDQEAPSDNDDTAFYAGVMVSVFTFGEFIMAPRWAAISDRIGRKPTLLIGSAGAIFSALAFGFTTSLPVAVMARFMAGMLNPNLGVVPTFVGELVSKEHQAQGFSIVPFIQGFGRMLGPVVGGYLAEPCKSYPSWFAAGTIWDEFPYLLPNLVVVAFLCISCVLGLLNLQEVHPAFHTRPKIGQALRRFWEKLFRRNVTDHKEVAYSSLISNEAGEATELTEMHGSNLMEEIKPIDSPYTQQVKYQILSNTLQGFIKIATLALVPIFLALPATGSKSGKADGKLAGGFGLTNQNISNILLSQAVAAILTQIWLVPRTVQRVGPLSSFRYGLCALMFSFFVIPFTAMMRRSAGLGGILVILWFNAYVNGLTGASSQILLTNTAPSPVFLARINGAATSIGCLGRTVGPAISGWLSQVGQSSGYVGLPFWVIGVVVALNLVVACTVMRDHP